MAVIRPGDSAFQRCDIQQLIYVIICLKTAFCVYLCLHLCTYVHMFDDLKHLSGANTFSHTCVVC